MVKAADRTNLQAQSQQQQQQYPNALPTRTSKTLQSVQCTDYVEEDYKDQRQQNRFVSTKTKPSFKRESHKNYQSSPTVAESNDWGAADNYVSCYDVQEQGFSKEGIEEQRNTLYWNRETYTNTTDTTKFITTITTTTHIYHKSK